MIDLTGIGNIRLFAGFGLDDTAVLAHLGVDLLVALSYLLMLWAIVRLNNRKYISVYIPRKTYIILFFVVLITGVAASFVTMTVPTLTAGLAEKAFAGLLMLGVVLGIWQVLPRTIDPYERQIFRRESMALRRAQEQIKTKDAQIEAALAETEDQVAYRTTEFSRVNMDLERKLVERRLSEERVTESKRRLDELIMRTNTALAFIDDNGKIIECNHALVQMLGRSSIPEIRGRELGRLLGQQDGGAFIHFCNETLRLGAFSHEFHAAPPARGSIYLEAHGASSVMEDKPCVMAFLRDVTERKAFENELIQGREGLSAALEVARKANAAKSDFLAKMNHELRTPLNGIIGLAEIIRHKSSGKPMSPDQVNNLVGNIHQSGSHLLSLVDDLLDLSRLDAGTREFKPAEVTVRTEVDAAVLTLTSIAEKKRIIVLNRCDADLDWMLDQRALKQVIINLVNNAVKFSPPGSKVEISADTTDDALCLHIRDEGPGITEEEQSHILSPFGRGDYAEDNKIDGVGLGLTIVSELLKLHGGRLDVESTPGEGSVFTAVFPNASELHSI